MTSNDKKSGVSSLGFARPMPPDVFEGDSCLLRALELRDWELEQTLSCDPDVVRWTYYPVDLTEQESRHRIQDSLERTRLGLVRRYAIVNQNTDPVGTCGIGELNGDRPRVSYTVLPRGRNQGLATTAAGLLAHWALACGYATVSLETIDGNQASERVASKAGFVPCERYQADHRGKPVWLTSWTMSG